MRVFRNILIAVGLLAGAVALSIVVNVLIPPGPGSSGSTTAVVLLMIIGTSVWAAISSSRLEFRSYKTGLAYHPVTLFIAHLLLWIVVFPWFLTIRARIKDGSAELKDEFKSAPYAAPTVSRTSSQSAAPWSTTESRIPTAAPDLIPPPIPAKPQTAQAPVPVTTPVPKADPDRLAQIQKLADFRAQGILSEEEFQAEKRRLLS